MNFSNPVALSRLAMKVPWGMVSTMSTYVVGDIQGCFASLQALLKKISFEPGRDELWAAGDLVNRGPDSLGVVQWLWDHRDSCQVVLGNHDFGLLRCYFAQVDARPKKDTFQDILSAPNVDTLLQWMRSLPLVIHRKNALMVHGGFLPQWDLETVLFLNKEIQKQLQGKEVAKYLKECFRKPPDQWKEDLQGMDRAVVATNIFARIRACRPDGWVDFEFNEEPERVGGGCFPWFEVPGRKLAGKHIYFGHWAALGFQEGSDYTALDTGCGWGRQLTAVCIETGERYSVENQERRS